MDKDNLKLRTHKPKEEVWNLIESELNKDLLKDDSIQYNPNDDVWHKINNELNKTDTFDSLPSYSPSEKIWRKIEINLHTGKILSLPNWLRIAATILIVLGFGFSINWFYQNKSSKLSYNELWIEPINTDDWNTEEDKNVSKIIERIESVSPSLLSSEEYLILKEEYFNLLNSKKMVLEEIGPYNENPHLELILTKIELEKSSIVRSLISFSIV
jgi:hypothetical protein